MIAWLLRLFGPPRRPEPIRLTPDETADERARLRRETEANLARLEMLRLLDDIQRQGPRAESEHA